jgi:prevent-host-death family protein
MVSFNIHEAKAQLSRLLRRVRSGEEVIIADAGTPIAKLVPIEPANTSRTLGADRDKIWIAADAFDLMGADELATWQGSVFPEPSGRPNRRGRASRPRRHGAPRRTR